MRYTNFFRQLAAVAVLPFVLACGGQATPDPKPEGGEEEPAEGVTVTVLTSEAEDVTGTGARLSGKVMIYNNESKAKAYIRFGTDESTVKAEGRMVDAGTVPATGGSFSVEVTGLDFYQRYYFLAVVEVDGKLYYGETIRSFSFLPDHLVYLGEGISSLWYKENLENYNWGGHANYETYNWWSYPLSNAVSSYEGSKLSSLRRYNCQSEYGTVDWKRALSDEDDPAPTGSRSPSRNDWEELIEKCRWFWENDGVRVTGPSGNSIFLPASGYWTGMNRRNSVGKEGHYWTNELNSSDSRKAYSIKFSEEYPDAEEGSTFRYLGLSVRPVVPLSSL